MEFELERVAFASNDEELACAGCRLGLRIGLGISFGIAFGEMRFEFQRAKGAAQAVGGIAADLLDEFGCGLAGVAGDFGRRVCGLRR